MSKPVTAEDVVALLNEALELDPVAVSDLFLTRVPCNEKLADHPTVQVLLDGDKQTTIGLLGLLNGIFGVNSRGRGFLEATVDDGAVKKFSVSAE